MQWETLETERLTLQKVTPEIYRHVFDDLSEVEQMAFFHVKKKDDLREEKNKYELGIRTHNRSFVHFKLILRETQEFIGGCGFHIWYLDHNRAEIGYNLLDDSFKGRGYMSEAMKAIIGYGFGEMKLHRIEALVSPRNLPSLALIRKFNFIKEGCLKQHYFIDDRYEDSEMYGLLNPNH